MNSNQSAGRRRSTKSPKGWRDCDRPWARGRFCTVRGSEVTTLCPSWRMRSGILLADRRYPLQLLTCKTRDRIHSQFGNLDWIREVERPCRLDIHPDNASPRGLADGDLARMWNDRGEVRILTRLNSGIRPGVLHVIQGRCLPDDPELNHCSCSRDCWRCSHDEALHGPCTEAISRAASRSFHEPGHLSRRPRNRSSPGLGARNLGMV